MLMSANERDINLHAENELGEGLPSYQVVIGGRSEADLLKSTQIDTYDTELCLTNPSAGKSSNTTNKLASQVVRDTHIVPSSNSNKNFSSNGSISNIKGSSNGLQDESFCSSKSTNNLAHSFQKKEPTTYVISNTRSCTLQVKSAGFIEIGSKKNKDKKQKEQHSTYTVQFNREKTTRTTTRSPPPIITSPAINPGVGISTSLNSSQEAVLSPTNISSVRLSTHFSLGGNNGDSKIGGAGGSYQGGGGGARVRGTEDSGRSNTMGGKERVPNTSHTSAATFSNMSTVGGTLGSPTTLAAGKEGPLNSNSSGANNIRSANSTKPCCFCWCCCCSCSWIRRRCLSVKATNGSLDPGTELSKDEDIGNVSISELNSWGESFEHLMNSESGRKVFRTFLRCEYSEENILFWLACEDLKKERNPDTIEEKARIIYEEYVSILSPREVSLDSRVREIINRNMINPSISTFDDAQLQIYTLMHRDSYPRFVSSVQYKNLLQAATSTSPNADGGGGGGSVTDEGRSN